MVDAAQPTFPPTLAEISRNASVISSSSDSESSVLRTPRPRPTRTFSSPRSRSPNSPPSQSARPPPAYLTRELGVSDGQENQDLAQDLRSKSRKRPRSRNPSANGRLSAQDFVFGETLGEGSYSTVMRARYARSGQEYAIKILDKNHLIRKEKMLVALAEKNTFVKLGAGHPGIIHLHWTFQDDWSLFFVLDLAPNGEMQSRISRLGSLSLACARHYTAQIVDAVEYMHDKDVIHRDLKPENLLLDSEYRIKITDFGTGKILENGQERANSFVGTAQYVSPELLERNETSKSSDLWSLGCIVFQMIAGRFAFQGLSEYLTWQKIKSLDYSFPDGFDEDAKDFVTKLLVRDPQQRLGVSRTLSSSSPLRSHPFLASVNWDTLWTDPPPPLEPGLVKKESPNGTGLLNIDGADARWNDVGAKWDALIGEDEDGEETEGTLIRNSIVAVAAPPDGRPRVDDDDGIGWADDAHGPEFERYQLKATGPFRRASRIVEEVGPMEERPDYTLIVDDGVGVESRANGENAHANVNGTDVGGASVKEDKAYTNSISPVSTLSATLIQIPVSLTALHNGSPPGSDFASLLLPGEVILLNTRVEARSPKRRGSRLRLPISVSPVRPKTRQLLLTTHRLLCVKQRVEGGATLKSELSLRKGVGASAGAEKPKDKEKDKDKDKDKENEAKSVVESVERKSEREFVVLTSTTSQTYAAESSVVASQWVEKINAALTLPRSPTTYS